MSAITVNGDADFQQISESTWQKMKIARLKDGFADGKYMGEESAVQDGFNNGYEVGFRTNFQIAVLKGVVGAVEANVKESKSFYLQEAISLKAEIVKLEHLCIEMAKQNICETDVKMLNSTSPYITNQNCATSSTNSKKNLFLLKCSGTPYDKELTEKLHTIKQRTLKLLEDSGHTALTKVIDGI